MAFKPGQSGNPGGRKSTAEISNALRLVVNEPISPTDKKKKARKLAEVLVDRALDGDVPAAREVMDRLEGKVPQAVEADVTGGITIELVHFADNPDPE